MSNDKATIGDANPILAQLSAQWAKKTSAVPDVETAAPRKRGKKRKKGRSGPPKEEGKAPARGDFSDIEDLMLQDTDLA